MTERQQPQIISSLETSNRHEDEEFDLENPDRTNDNRRDASEHDSEQYTDDDGTTSTKRYSAYRWATAAIVMVTIIIIFLSRGSLEGVDAKNQDVEKEGAVLGGDPRGKTSLGGGNTEEVAKAEKGTEQKVEKSHKSKKSKKSKADKW